MLSETEAKTNKKEEKSFMDKVKDVSLRASGIGFLLGDASFFAADYFNKNPSGMATGAIYLIGAGAAARYGKENPERQIELLARELRAHFKKEGIEIPKGSALNAEALTKPRGVLDHIEDFLYKNPSQILNGMFSIGGLLKVASGLKESGKERYSTIAYGGLVALAGLIGLLVEEKAPDKEHPPTTAMGKLWEKIQESPLGAASKIYLINNVFLLGTAYAQRKTHLESGTKPGYYFTFLTAASYIVANGLLGLSTKDHAKATKEDNKHIESLETMCAEVLANVPVELRQRLIERSAGFLAAHPEVKLSAAEVAKAIHGKVNEQLASVTKKPENWQEKIVGTASLNPAPSLG